MFSQLSVSWECAPPSLRPSTLLCCLEDLLRLSGSFQPTLPSLPSQGVAVAQTCPPPFLRLKFAFSRSFSTGAGSWDPSSTCLLELPSLRSCRPTPFVLPSPSLLSLPRPSVASASFPPSFFPCELTPPLSSLTLPTTDLRRRLLRFCLARSQEVQGYRRLGRRMVEPPRSGRWSRLVSSFLPSKLSEVVGHDADLSLLCRISHQNRVRTRYYDLGRCSRRSRRRLRLDRRNAIRSVLLALLRFSVNHGVIQQ